MLHCSVCICRESPRLFRRFPALVVTAAVFQKVPAMPRGMAIAPSAIRGSTALPIARLSGNAYNRIFQFNRKPFHENSLFQLLHML